MNILDFMEIWWISISPLLRSSGSIGNFKRFPDGGTNPSCGLNLRFNSIEIDLLIWESKEAEFSELNAEGSVFHEHFDDVSEECILSVILTKFIDLALQAQVTTK